MIFIFINQLIQTKNYEKKNIFYYFNFFSFFIINEKNPKIILATLKILSLVLFTF